MKSYVLSSRATANVASALLNSTKTAKIRSMGLRQIRGFSLIEVVMAIGIISFAFLSILGLVPMGMNAFRAASDRSIGTWITQQVVNEVQQTDFSTITKATTSTAATTSNLPTRYYDVDGGALKSASGAVPSGTIYQVNVRVQPSPTLPGATDANQNLATITVQIANNPGNQQLTPNGTTYLWPSTPGVSMTTYSAVISGYLASTSN